MTAPNPAIVFDRVVKQFRLFASPLDRLKEALHPAGKRYHTPLPVLREVTFSIPHGQTVAVLGANGVGKSTLLNLAAGLLDPSSGTVTVTGSVFGLLDLTGSFAPELSGRENVRFFHEVVLKGAGDWIERQRFVQAFADIGDHFDRPVRTYSSGMFLRLAFATAISARPDVLLIDEVLAVGDARFQQKCFRRIRELREQGATIVLVTHAVEIVRGLCDRVLLFDHGELVYDGEPVGGVDRYYRLFFAAEGPPLETSLDDRRYGTGTATIVRAFASLDGVNETSRFNRGERATIVMEVEFHRAANPHFGFGCTTKQGLRVYATTTVVQGKPAAADPGERRRVEITFTLSVAVADLFIDLSVFELNHGSIEVLEAWMGALHLSVTAMRYCDGIADLGASFEESVLSPPAALADLEPARRAGP